MFWEFLRRLLFGKEYNISFYPQPFVRGKKCCTIGKAFFSWRDSPLGLLLIHEDFCGFYITHDTPQLVGLLWTNDQSVAETST